jgi:hypothetical protein
LTSFAAKVEVGVVSSAVLAKIVVIDRVKLCFVVICAELEVDVGFKVEIVEAFEVSAKLKVVVGRTKAVV